MDQLSLPKDKIRVLLLEGVNDSAVDLFTSAGYKIGPTHDPQCRLVQD